MDPSDTDVYSDPAQVLRRFIADMNAWELRTAARNKVTPPAEHRAFWAEARETLREIFDRWCTPKERKAGRLGYFQEPPEYQPDTEDIGETVVESPRRASVYTRRRSGFMFQHKYVLLKRDGRWLLDSVKWRATDSDKWSNGVL